MDHNPVAPPSSPVRLAGPPEITTECALPALAELVVEGLNLEVTLGRPAERLLDLLVAQQCDLVLSTIQPHEPDLTVDKLPDEQFVLVGSQYWRDRAGDAGTDNLPMISVGKSQPVIRRYWRTLYDRNPPGPPAVVVADLRAVLRLVMEGAGVSVLPRYLCKTELEKQQLFDLVSPKVVPTNELFLATRTDGADGWVTAVRDRLIASAPTW